MFEVDSNSQLCAVEIRLKLLAVAVCTEMTSIKELMLILSLHEAPTSTSSHVLQSEAFRFSYTLIENRGEWVCFSPDEELHRSALCGPSLTVDQPQALSLDLMKAKFIDAVIDEGDWSFFVQNCHLE